MLDREGEKSEETTAEESADFDVSAEAVGKTPVVRGKENGGRLLATVPNGKKNGDVVPSIADSADARPSKEKGRFACCCDNWSRS